MNPVLQSCYRAASTALRHTSATSRNVSTVARSRTLSSGLWLDFLLPPLPRPSHPSSARQITRSYHSKPPRNVRNVRQFFSTIQAATTVITNPRQNEDGQDMLVEITPRASNRLKEIMAKDNNPEMLLRVSVESGGCHGFQYLMSLIDNSKVSTEDDTVFEAGDGTGARFVMDEPSLELLNGSKIDYTMELIGSQFKVVGNPRATSSCGCGTSFDIQA